ncbi:MAG: non-ribosomal peptide synthase/polyketide synthase, partial [Candidatus Polarisedimenticolia bacterium]
MHLKAPTIGELLRRRAAEHPERTVFTFLGSSQAPAATLTLGQLSAHARAIGARLAREGLRGERALLLYPAGLDFVAAFFACLEAGVIAVPAPPPRNARALARIALMAVDCGARAALVPPSLLERSREAAREQPSLAALRWMSAGTGDADPPEGEAVQPPADPHGLAYLQYTSGSTSEPKGVMVGHANVMANSEAIRRGFRHSSRSRSLTWLPHFHDMGLIDGIIQPVYAGFHAALMDPASFLQNPTRWLQAISDHAITHSGAPDFAYDLCARRVSPEPGRLDLRRWKVACNGAEPVRAATLERFAAQFASCGFDPCAFFPAYGLAEATLKVSGGPRGRGATVVALNGEDLEAGRVTPDPSGRRLVGSGRPDVRTRVRIVGPAGEVLPEGRVGEIWVRGPGVALGYWNRPQESVETFGAGLPGVRGRHLRTGDLGFFHAGELFVTGRLKDIIIIRGRNIHPQDVEATASACSPRLSSGGGAAFGVETSQGEGLVVVLEAGRHLNDAAELLASVRAAIVEAHEVDPHAIVLVPPAAVPRTSSGKVRRRACRQAFLEGSLPVTAAWREAVATRAGVSPDAGPGGASAWLAARIAAKLGVEAGSIALDQPLARHGLDSLRSVELAHEIEEAFGASLSAVELMEAASLAEIAGRLAEPAPAPAGAPAAARDEEPPECPLSAGQRALWFLHHLAPESRAYTIASALRLSGPLNEDAMEQAWRDVIGRHPSLRARILSGPEPRQRFDVPSGAILSRGDLRGVPEAAMASRLADEAHRPFDLERGPLVRVTLFDAGDQERILLIAAHHAVADLWSLSVVLRDLQAAYGAALDSSPAPSGPAPHPFAFVRWQQQLVEGLEGDRQLRFWLDRLGGDLPPLELPADRVRPAAQTFRGGARTARLAPATVAAARRMARARGVSLYTVLLSAWQALLGRVTPHEEILIGSPAAGRTRAGFSDLVAYLVNTVVLRCDLRGDPAFGDLIAATHRRVMEALAHQDYPFPLLVRRLAPHRDPARSPLFDTMFELRTTGERVRGDLASAGGDARVLFAGGVEGKPVEVERRTSAFDLSVTVGDDGDTLGLELEYNADLFDPSTVDELGRGFETLLAAAVESPSTRVSRLPVIPAARRAEILGPPVRAARPEVCFPRLFAAQASARPHAAAAVHTAGTLTYGRLDERARALARRLRAAGVAPESRVAVIMDKSLDLLVALMAVLKAGGAYVPVDPRLPASRRRFLIEDSGSRVVLADPGVQVHDGPLVLLTGDDLEGPTASDGDETWLDPPPDSLAYVIYTSGTTGEPKGVGVTHAALMSAFFAWDRAYDLASIRGHLQVAAPGFDVFTGDLVRALGSGGTLVLCGRDTLLDPDALAALVRAHRPQFTDILPTVLRELASLLVQRGERLDTFRQIAIGAEAWSMADYDLFRRAFGPATRLMNSYGVTEATIDSLFGQVADEDRARTVPPLGRPLENTSAFVLDEHLEPLPSGVRGELYLGGAALARGYLNRPGLTAERFLPDPHGTPGSRLYRTGDLARRLADGRIEFLGRADHQVKIRGHRVEPAEVEAILDADPRVRACAVVARKLPRGTRLIAYVVPRTPGAADIQGLRDALAARLPEAMVPSAFVELDALPLSPNGKVDRRALAVRPWVAEGMAAGGGELDDVERRLAGIWSDVLSVERVGAHDNFFTLGGDSILVIQVVSRARAAGLSFPPRALFENPTVAALARAVRPFAAPTAPLAVEPPPAPDTSVPLLPLQRWFFAQQFDDPGHWNMAIALQAREPVDPDAARAAARAVMRRHDALRARFTRGGDGWVQTIAPPDDELDPLRVEPAAGAVTTCAQRLHAGLDLEKGPLALFGLVVDEPGGKGTLVFVGHHLVVDGVSLRLIVEDFERAYRQARDGREIRLPDPTAPTAVWAARLRHREAAGRDDGPPAPAVRLELLPLRETAAAPLEGSTVRLNDVLDPATTDRLLRSAVALGAPVESVLLSAFSMAWARWTGGRAVAVELEGHGRAALEDLDVSRTVGWFTEVRPVIIDGIDPLDPLASLRAVRRATSSGTNGPAVVPEISFNYLGRFDDLLAATSLFEGLAEPACAARSPRARRTHPLEIDLHVAQGSLAARWSFSGEQLDEEAVAALARDFRQALEELASLTGAEGDEVEAVLPLTPMQEGMLFHHLREAGSDPYMAQISLELTGTVDAGALVRAWQMAVDRHAALRTTFSLKEGARPLQIVRSHATLPSTLHPAGAVIDAVMEQALASGFDVSRAPLARLDVVPGSDGALTAIFTHHHLLFDGWSLPLVIGTVFDTYDALVSGRPLPEAKAVSSRGWFDWLDAQDSGEAERFFRDNLAGLTAPTPAPPAGTPARPDRAPAGSAVAHGAATDGTIERARALGLTASAVVQAAWALVLAACTGRRDVVFGATSSGRPAQVDGIASMVGLFINTLPVRAQVDPRVGALGWMRELQTRGAALRQHEHAPLAMVQRCAPTPPQTPLFETLLVFENYPIDLKALGRRERFAVTGMRLHEETNYPLTIVATGEEGLRFRAIYDRARYDEEGVLLILERLATAIDSLLAHPDAPLGFLCVLPAHERERLLTQWNDTTRPFRHEATLVDVFDEVARERPDHAALLFEETTITYADLRHRARTAALALRARGVGPESRVALAMDRSPELIVAMLGVLEAGGAYVPIDPESPDARTARTLASSGATLVVAGDGRTAPGGDVPVVRFEELQVPPENGATLPRVSPSSLAYVMFTSGSTGRPKGIEITHRNILRLVSGADYVRFGPGETFLHLSSIAFDLTTFEVWGALMTGARLAIAPQGAASAAGIAALIRRHGVTVLWLTSGLFQVVVDEEVEALAQVRQVLAGGDVVSPAHVRRLLAAGCPRVINGYGPTETTTFATTGALSPGEELGERVPIGRPISNTRVYVLDDAMAPVPIGGAAELYVGGEGVARGYAGRPDLTAERFVPDPFGPPGGRLYATGDLVSWRADARLEFLGRRDRQVKVRGFRVEVDDVESALLEVEGVRAAAVVVRREVGSSDLIGYVTTDGEAADPAALRQALARRVPPYMIPSRLIVLDRMPLSGSGKIDRRALPAPGAEPSPVRGASILTPAEEMVAGIWRLVLGVDGIGPDDDFFALGGHSLHATRVVARLRRLGIDVPLHDLFDAPTVRGLARRLEAAGRGPSPPLVPATGPERRLASFAQSRLWFLDRLEPSSAAYTIAGAIRIEGDLSIAALDAALTDIVRRHEALRTRFEEGPDGLLATADPDAVWTAPLEDLRHLPAGEDREREATRRIGTLAREPFDLQRGPLVRARLLRIDPHDHVLALAMHHVVSDGWSLGVLVNELTAAYAARARGEPPRLPPLAVQYADWAAWQRAWLQEGEMERQLAWWRAEMEGLEPLVLPTDRPRPARPTGAGGSLPLRLDGRLVESLTRGARAEGATLHMALMAAFAAVLGRWSGQTRFGIGTPVANRTHPEAEPLIGLFVNTLVVSARLEGKTLTWRRLLRGIRQAALGAHAHQDVPFERVVEAVQPERDLARTPLFQVMLILQNAPMGRLELDGLKMRAFEAPTGTSTFDLTISLEPPLHADPADPGSLAGAAEYSTELFDEATIERLWDQMVRMLNAVAHDPDTDVRRVALMSAAQRDRALQIWSGRRGIAQPGPLLHERFAEIAARHPGREAAVLEGRRVTYGELDAWSWRIARRLARHGVSREVPVGLCVDRSPEMLAGMMGIMRSGGTFVPLDPDHPRERIAFALSDARARLVLATRARAGAVEPGIPVLLVDADVQEEESGSPSMAPPGPASRDFLSYIIYTSGTTGRPKGVMVSHGALASACDAWVRLYGLEEIRRHLQMAGIAFDVCIGDVARALGTGGTLIFCPRERLLDPARLFDLARGEAVEFAEFVPAVLRQLAAHARSVGERLETLRVAAVGSDVWTLAELREFRGVFGPRTRLANSYGVTEATIDSTCWFAGSGEETAGSPPIGRPLSHTAVYVLDDHFEPVPPGIGGELYLGGPAVARGYAGRPAQTAERFVPDPFGEPGSRLYRTGDRARCLPDGDIVFLGRADDQVKIRGQRIEPSEVEAALADLDAIAAAAVVARRGPGGAPALAAYVVPRGTGFDTEAAREELRRRLPEAMVPAAIVVMEALPLNPNGKVDRRRLPEPDWGATRADEPPSTAAEAAVAAAYATVLDLERVGAGDDFFALGGHSLLATRVISRLRASLGVEVPLRALFEAPQVRRLAAVAESLTRGGAPPPVRRALDRQRRRLSYAQRRLWFLDRLQPDTAAYNLPSSLLLEGDLDTGSLERALTRLVERHEALRTRFEEGPDGPEQVIAPAAPMAMAVIDLMHLPEAARRDEAQRLAGEEARIPFDLARAPLLRAKLLRLARDRHALLLTVHHIAADGWSLAVMVRELGALYGAFIHGQPDSLPELAVQYADWAAWQRAWLEQGEMDRQLEWWRAEMEGAATLTLPGDRPRPARRSFAGATLDVQLDASLTQRLEQLARAEGATLHMALLAGYAAALSSWSGQKDIVVGTPVANRRTAEAEPLIGFFVNTLAMRVRLAGQGLTFRGLLARVRESALGAQASQDVPFERVVEAIHPERSLDHNPLFQVLFALQNVPVGSIEMPGIGLSWEEPHAGLTRFDLELFLAEGALGLDGLINYSAELFDRETVERFVQNFIALLEAAAVAPDRPLASLPSLAPAQLETLLARWNPPRAPWPDPLVVHTLFERWAETAPDAVAARFGGISLSYGELDARANRLARRLRREGVGPEQVVAVCVERSFDMLIALLASMKAGAAYVPVDPEYPPERIALLLRDSGARLVLTQARLAEHLPLGDLPALRLDEQATEIALEDEARLGPVPHPDQLVYVVYTSGSTGRPKGVAMTHRAISNLLSWQRRDSRSGEGERAPRTLQFASLSFDVSFQEIFSTLTAGGEVVLLSEDERRDTARMLAIISGARVERLFVPFVALNQLAEAASQESELPGSLREIDTAGERLAITPPIATFFSRLPHARLVNHYGPSETHLVTTFELAGAATGWPELPPIGRPIANATVYLLDAEGRPVPIGTPGELYVGGEGLARGYHGRADLTADAFVPDPFSGIPGARLYRTGDLARHRHDGLLDFLGRRDMQVKVRGYRVEPAEIESALARLPGVRQAAVRAHEHGGGRRLAAYVVLHKGARPTPDELRDALASSLPEFMVPSAIVLLDALPLTPNGKIDRRALAEPDWGAMARRVPPRTPEEEIACGLFAEVLGLSGVGATDDFFHLGGHSLLATQVVSRARRAFGAEIALRAVFEAPTPRGLAAAALEARGSGAAIPPPIVQAQPAERRSLSYAQSRLWFLDRLEPGLAVYNVPAAVRLEGTLDAGALERALHAIVERHEALRTRFVDGPHGPEQHVDPAAALGMELVQVAGEGPVEREAEACRLLAQEAVRPFDLGRGPLLRARLLRLEPHEHILSLVVHHIAADGWSIGVLLSELGALYGAFVRDGDSPLPPLPIQYADWAAWQRAWLDAGEMERQIGWWRGELGGAPPALDLPADRARPAQATWNGATLAVRLPAALHMRLQRVARAEGATLHMVLLAGYAWTLMIHAGRRDVVIGTPVANRRITEAEALVGFFVNTLPVRVRLDGREPSFRDLIARVREASLGAYANQDVPFERLVEALQPERSLNSAPIVQTAFALQTARLPQVELPGLRMTLDDTETGTAKFDLMLTLQEEEGELAGALEYNCDLFDRSTMERLTAAFERILADGSAEPDAPLGTSARAGDEAARLVLESWSGAGAADPPEGLLHEMVERQARLTPGAPALARGDACVTYGRLEERANRLAHHLAALGAGPGRRVAILRERSPEFIVTMLAVLKAGAAYVPLEPGDPPERVRHILADSGAMLVVTETGSAGVAGAAGIPLLDVDSDEVWIAQRPSTPPRPRMSPRHLAYLIYTSGSTGRPKGVAVEHRQITAYAAAAIERLGIEPGWSFALLSTLSADLGLTAVYPALATGGCLHVLPAEESFDAPAVERYAAAHPIDCLKIVPSHLQALMSGARPQAVLPRRLLVLGGEAAPGDRLRLLAALRPECRIANHYGPTEATVGAVAGSPLAADSDRAIVPLGRPLSGTRAYVLDAAGRPTPAGVPGELHLGGAGIARGYLGRPALTAERFVPDPFGATPGGRLYRTGDRARWLSDGRLEFLGRADGQVKVRGVRVELAEIEAALAADPDVLRAAVVPRADPAGGTRLAAFVVARPRVAPVLNGLRRRRLADGVAVAELNRNETDYLHREIFELGAYARHGITLRDGDTLVDAGANIGLFTIWASLVCARPRVVAFEPNPHLQPILRANAAAYAPDAVILDAGLADRERTASFTFFPGFSLLSGLHADPETEKQVVRSFLENQARAGVEGADTLAREAGAMLDERFRSRRFDVRLRALADVAAEQGLERIHLLKVNVEKSELDVLRGIDASLWRRVDQAVIEVDLAAHLDTIVRLFESNGFTVLVDQDPLLDGTPLRYVYAVRGGSGRALVPGAPPSCRPAPVDAPLLTPETLRERLARSLPGPMLPAAWAFLDALPLTSNGKLDRSRLPEPGEVDAAYVAPRGEVQTAIARIWAEVLQRDRVGAHDNFFDLGGHSLLLTRVHARLRETFDAHLTVVEMFRFPTIAALAARLAEPPADDAGTGSARERAA